MSQLTIFIQKIIYFVPVSKALNFFLLLLDDLVDADFDEDIRQSEQANTKQASSIKCEC